MSDHRGYRWQCPDCGTIHTAFGSIGPVNKSLDVFSAALHRLVARDAESAAQGFAQFNELWLKGIIQERDPEWLVRHPRPKYAQLVARIRALYELSHFTRINKTLRNDLEHDLSLITSAEEARGYGEHVLDTMWANLMELIGEDTWLRGEAAELSSCGQADSEEHFRAFWRYHHHYRTGAVGAVMWARTWWSAYRSGRTDWHRAQWIGGPGRANAVG